MIVLIMILLSSAGTMIHRYEVNFLTCKPLKVLVYYFLTKPATKGNAKGPLSDLHLNNNVIIHCVPNVKINGYSH